MHADAKRKIWCETQNITHFLSIFSSNCSHITPTTNHNGNGKALLRWTHLLTYWQVENRIKEFLAELSIDRFSLPDPLTGFITTFIESNHLTLSISILCFILPADRIKKPNLIKFFRLSIKRICNTICFMVVSIIIIDETEV